MIRLKIPESLQIRTIQSEDVNIIVGENGSGKSFLLAQLAQMYHDGNYSNIIAIANTIFDKFEVKGRRFHPLRVRQGRRLIKETFKKVLRNLSKNDEKKFRFISRALSYVNYDPKIGIKIRVRNLSDINYRIDKIQISDKDKEEIHMMLQKLNNLLHNEIIWLSMKDYSFYELERFSLIDFFKWETQLIKSGIIAPLELFLSKSERQIPVLSASSGELSLINSIVYISSVIDDNSVILIDEPENSLHPKWQREYVRIIMDIFYYYQPRIVIATHSPLVISGALLSVEKTKVFKAHNFEFVPQKIESRNIEEIFFDYFDTTTPENRFLSQYLINNLNLLSKNNIEISEFNKIVNDLRDSITDERQLIVLNGIIRIAEKINSK